jgi:8-oxo-dGTP diphosphatase
VKQVRAAAGVVVRRSPKGTLEVLVVHRPRYDDWTFPKGKLVNGEDEEDAALREVEEETGLVCTLGREIASTRYRDSRGRPKLVTYYLMRPRGGSFAPHEEVDEIRWADLDDAAALLSYQRDRAVLDTVPADAV